MADAKVLVVDDDADWREFLSVSLAELGYEPLQAANGDAALALVAAEHPEVMLLDLHMPGMSGEEVVSRLPRGERTKVVVLTSAPVQEAAGALGSGAYYYLPKGASREQLLMMLQSLDLS